MAKRYLIALAVCLIGTYSLHAQDNLSNEKKLSFPGKFLNALDKKTSHFEEMLTSKTEKTLKQLSKEERRLKRKLYRRDSAAAKQIFQGDYYQSLQAKLKENPTTEHREYIAYLDTISTSLHFFDKTNSLKDNKEVKDALDKVNSMQGRFSQAADIQKYLKERRNYLKEQFSKLGMVQELKRYNKQVYYFSAQVNEYKSMLNDPQKLERKAIDLLMKTKTFQDFLRKYSVLGSLFSSPSGVGATGNLPSTPGLQTVAQVNGMVQQNFAGPNNSLASLQNTIQNAQGQIQQLKDRISKNGGSSDDDLPTFKPNNQKVKPFWKRIELGSDLQSSRGNYWLPSMTQFGLSVGYKLNDKSVAGIGAAGSIGWGKDIKHIIVSYQGVSARSFFDWKLKRSFWVSAGYELNYQRSFTKIDQLKALDAWQQSGLIGLSKKYQVTKKFKGQMKLLWDYLSYRQIPRTQPIIFRLGYSIK